MPDGPVGEPCEVDELEQFLDDAVERLVRADLRASVEIAGDGEFAMLIQGRIPEWRNPRISAVNCRPAALAASEARPLKDGTLFEGLRLEEISGFLTIEVSARHERRTRHRRFARPIAVTGLPPDRLQRLIAGTLESRQRLLQLLWLLLSPDGEFNYIDFTKGGGGAENPAPIWGTALSGLLERTLETLASRPERLDHVDRLIGELRSTEFGAELIGDDFADAWESVMAVRKRRASGSRS